MACTYSRVDIVLVVVKMAGSGVGTVLRRELLAGARTLDTRIQSVHLRAGPTLKMRGSDMFHAREFERFTRYVPHINASDPIRDGAAQQYSIESLFAKAFPSDEAMQDSTEAGFAALRTISRRNQIYKNQTYSPAKPDYVKLDIGNVFHHKKHGFRGVVVQWFLECPAGPDWLEQWGPFKKGANQPFYRTLVDTHDRPQPFMALAAEENLEYLPNPEGPEVSHPKIDEFFTDFEFGHFVLKDKMAWAFPEDW